MISFNQHLQRTTQKAGKRGSSLSRDSMVFFIIIGFLAISVIAGAGCGKGDSVTGPDIPHNNDSPDDDDNTGGLSFYEEQLVGLWSRYHSYDGSTMYLSLNGDRTACKWEEASGSNHRLENRSYSNWYVDEANPIGEYRFRVVVDGAGITYTFDYLSDQIWPSSYSNLGYYPSSESKTVRIKLINVKQS